MLELWVRWIMVRIFDVLASCISEIWCGQYEGEVFVLDDGGEVDLDLGNYERFIDVSLSRDNNITTGKIYKTVIEREVWSFICSSLLAGFSTVSSDMVTTLEKPCKLFLTLRTKFRTGLSALPRPQSMTAVWRRMFVLSRYFLDDFFKDQKNLTEKTLVGWNCRGHWIRTIYWSNATIPVPCWTREFLPCSCFVDSGRWCCRRTKNKTNSSQRSRFARTWTFSWCGIWWSSRVISLWIFIVVLFSQIACRSSKPLEDDVARKISMFCHVPPEQVMAVHDCKSVYHVPILLEKQGMVDVLLKRLQLTERVSGESSHLWSKWRQMADRYDFCFFQEFFNRSSIK